MTIKQQGGVFGRNPTFNNIEVEGTGTFDSGIDVTGNSEFNDRLTVRDAQVRIVQSSNTSRLEVGVDATSAYLKAAYSSNGTRDIRFLSISNEIARITANGLTFNGDTAAANALDDYEEGTFTPALTTTGTGFTSVTYDYQNGFYTKIGNIVSFSISLRTSAVTIGSASGFVLVSLPFSASAAQGGACGPTRSFVTSNPSAWVTTGSNAYLTFKTAAIGDFSYIAPANIATGASGNELRLSGTYRV